MGIEPAGELLLPKRIVWLGALPMIRQYHSNPFVFVPNSGLRQPGAGFESTKVRRAELL
ncbi:hypothetical protein ACIGB6_06800 [Paeniglutamicibacter gangotriensis]|uniref:hypothetical protein n=1 Tax=Paeniglutamicibacter gangotriensis TaxID=254787 RepID=UPI0037C9795A